MLNTKLRGGKKGVKIREGEQISGNHRALLSATGKHDQPVVPVNLLLQLRGEKQKSADEREGTWKEKPGSEIQNKTKQVQSQRGRRDGSTLRPFPSSQGIPQGLLCLWKRLLIAIWCEEGGSTLWLRM